MYFPKMLSAVNNLQKVFLCLPFFSLSMKKQHGLLNRVYNILLKGPYSSKINSLSPTEGLINRYMVLIQSSNMATDSCKIFVSVSFLK